MKYSHSDKITNLIGFLRCLSLGTRHLFSLAVTVPRLGNGLLNKTRLILIAIKYFPRTVKKIHVYLYVSSRIYFSKNHNDFTFVMCKILPFPCPCQLFKGKSVLLKLGVAIKIVLKNSQSWRTRLPRGNVRDVNRCHIL